MPRQNEMPFMMIRLWPEHHNNPQLLDQLLYALTRNRAACDEVWFATEFGSPTLDEHRASAARMAVAAEGVRAAGFLPGVQVANTLGHADLLFNSMEGIAWRSMVDANGTMARTCACPRDPAFHHYLDEMMRAYAAFQPSSVWIDDDLRMLYHGPVVFGCFCEACVAAFATEQEQVWTRASLVDALDRDGELRMAWLRFGEVSLARVARTVADAVHAVAPDCRLGLQNCGHEWGHYNGRDWSPVLQALAVGSGHPTGSRPGGGFYHDHAPREMLSKGYDIARQVARLPESTTLVCPEIENFIHVSTGKSLHGTAVESTLDLALGCNSLSYAILCAEHESMEWYETLLAQLASWRPFWERYVAEQAGTVPGGLDVVFGNRYAARSLPSGAGSMAWGHGTSLAPAYQLAALSLPLCPDGPTACATVLHPNTLDSLGDDEIRALLRGGVVTDGVVIDRLHAHGFSAELGFSVQPTPLDGFEYFTSDPLNGTHTGHIWKVFFGDAPRYTIRPTSPTARVLAEYRNYYGEVTGPATVLTDTTLGGRWAVIGNSMWEVTVSSARRAQLLAAADWVSGGRLPVIIDTVAQVVAVPRVTLDGRLRSVLLVNVSLDETPPLDLRLRGVAGGVAHWLQPQRRTRSLALSITGDAHTVTTPHLAPWSVAYLRL